MTGKKPIIILKNNTDVSQEVNLFNIRPNLSGNINANLTYQWDITAQNLYQLSNLQLQVSTPGQAGFTTLSAQITSSDVSGIVAALNSLNVGYFYATRNGATTIINSSNKIFTYGDLTINPTTTNWITTGSLFWNKPFFFFGPVFINSSDVRSATILSASNVPLVSPFEVIPYDNSLTYPTSSLQPGDSIQTTIQAPVPGPFNVRLIVDQNGTQILDQTQNTALGIFFFNYVLNATYNFTATIS